MDKVDAFGEENVVQVVTDNEASFKVAVTYDGEEKTFVLVSLCSTLH